MQFVSEHDSIYLVAIIIFFFTIGIWYAIQNINYQKCCLQVLQSINLQEIDLIK